jgi:hypothetical protein
MKNVPFYRTVALKTGGCYDYMWEAGTAANCARRIGKSSLSPQLWYACQKS